MMSGTTTSLASEVQRMNKHNFLCLGVSFYSKSIFQNDWHRRAMSNFRTLFFNLGFWDRLSPAKVVGDSSPSKSKYQMLLHVIVVASLVIARYKSGSRVLLVRRIFTQSCPGIMLSSRNRGFYTRMKKFIYFAREGVHPRTRVRGFGTSLLRLS